MNEKYINGLDKRGFPRRAWSRQSADEPFRAQPARRRWVHDRFGLLAFLISVSLFAVTATATQSGPPSYADDNSDWWSHARSLAFDKKNLVQNREPSASNFQILGIELDDNMFNKIAVRLGKTPIVERGDAATGRSQVCYVSQEDPGRMHLVFEKGEVTESFYLFEGGPGWKGSELCVRSNLVTKSLAVASGLRLGQKPAEIRAILGKPSAVTGTKLIYSFSVQKKSSAADFENLKPRYPELSEEELHRNYEFYTLGVYVEGRFSDEKLTYLSVTKSEAY